MARTVRERKRQADSFQNVHSGIGLFIAGPVISVGVGDPVASSRVTHLSHPFDWTRMDTCLKLDPSDSFLDFEAADTIVQLLEDKSQHRESQREREIEGETHLEK